MSQRTKPPFRADHVGSLLRPAALKRAREQHAKGEITPAQLKDIEDREIERVIEKQEEVGLQSITDGEFRRSWWHLDFLWGLDGIEKHVMDTGIHFAAVTTRNEGLKVSGKVGFSGHPMIEHFKFVAAHTNRTPKITIPSPSAAYGRPIPTPIDKKIYPKLDAFFDDLDPHLAGKYILRPTRPKRAYQTGDRRRLQLKIGKCAPQRHLARQGGSGLVAAFQTSEGSAGARPSDTPV